MACFGLLVLLASPVMADSQVDCSVEGACCFPRRSQRVVGPPASQLATVTAIAVSGPLGKPAAKRALGNRAAALGACTRKGEASAHLVVAPSGAVEVTRLVAKPPIGQRADVLATCATAALRDAVFPQTTGVTEIDVRITW